MAAQQASAHEQVLIGKMMEYRYDPMGFALFAFPWGGKNTPVERMDGPRKWQAEQLVRIGEHLLDDVERQRRGDPARPIYLAVSSGRGPGKSALISMLGYWVMTCWPGATTIVTANTEAQLRSRTMAELGKWHTMALNRHWFEKNATSLRPEKWWAKVVEDQLKIDTQYYYIDAQSWSADNPDAFAGAHSQIGMMLAYDEASGIDDRIWNVSEGFFTDLSPLRLWLAISNPRRNSGKFFDCFHKDAEYWRTVSIDSRTVEGVDSSVYQRIADKYGEDHDVTRVEVRGLFPRTGSNQFFSREVVHDAATRELYSEGEDAPLLMGVDVARFGDDESVIRFRRGRDARSKTPVRFKGVNTMELAAHVMNLIEREKPDYVFVDGGGVGGGVVDRLKQMGYRGVIEVQSGTSATEPDKHMNKRVEMWDKMREWMQTGCIDADDNLIDDLLGPEYEIALKGQIKLESKDSMKKRGLRSTDDADALALTFAIKVFHGKNDKPLPTKANRVSPFKWRN